MSHVRRSRRAFQRGSTLAALSAICAATVAASGPEAIAGADRAQAATRLSPRVDHPLVPLSSVRLAIFKGSERDPRTRKVTELGFSQRVLERTGRVAGARVAVVGVKEYEQGELVEATRDYYAQRPDGTVLYMGERVNDYEDGRIVGHEGAWLTGQAGAKVGIFMPPRPGLGDRFEQERVPGVAEDRSRVVGVDLEVTTPAGRFSKCIKTRDYAPLNRGTEFKLYCPGVGLVREQAAGTRIDLVRYFKDSRRN